MLYTSRLLLVDKPMHAKHSGKLLLLLSELTDPKLLFAIFRHYLAEYFFIHFPQNTHMGIQGCITMYTSSLYVLHTHKHLLGHAHALISVELMALSKNSET